MWQIVKGQLLKKQNIVIHVNDNVSRYSMFLLVDLNNNPNNRPENFPIGT